MIHIQVLFFPYLLLAVALVDILSPSPPVRIPKWRGRTEQQSYPSFAALQSDNIYDIFREVRPLSMNRSLADGD